ncbi:MAG: hypothetical protein AAB229_03055 [Candidatus Hydrogenedentota bacterium]
MRTRSHCRAISFVAAGAMQIFFSSTQVHAVEKDFTSWLRESLAKSDSVTTSADTNPPFRLSRAIVNLSWFDAAMDERGGTAYDTGHDILQTGSYAKSHTNNYRDMTGTEQLTWNWSVVRGERAAFTGTYTRNWQGSDRSPGTKVDQYTIHLELPEEIRTGDPIIVSGGATGTSTRTSPGSSAWIGKNISFNWSGFQEWKPDDYRPDGSTTFGIANGFGFYSSATAAPSIEFAATLKAKPFENYGYSGIRYEPDITTLSGVKDVEEAKRQAMQSGTDITRNLADPNDSSTWRNYQNATWKEVPSRTLVVSATTSGGMFDEAGMFLPRIFYTRDTALPEFWKCDLLKLPSIAGKGTALGGIRAEHLKLGEELSAAARRKPPEKTAAQSPEEYAKVFREYVADFDKEVLGKDEEIRSKEKWYFEQVAANYGSLPDAGIAAIRAALAEEADCLARAAARTLDEMRKKSYRFVEDSDYMRLRKYYDRYLKNLQHILAVWSNVNRMEILRLEMTIAEHQKARASADPGFSAPELDRLRVALKNVHADEGRIHLLREMALASDALDARDCYGEGLKAAKKENDRLPNHDEFMKRTAQRAITGTQYLMAIFNTMWTTLVDNLARLFNAAGAGGIVETLHEQTDRQIKDVRKSTLARLEALEAVRKLDAAGTRQLGDWLTKEYAAPFDEKKLIALDDNRMFHEVTSGGLLRFAACMADDYDQLLDFEFRIAAKHGRLVWKEMRITVNMREGRSATGGDPLLKRMLDPLGTWKTYCQAARGNYDSMEDYLAERSGQLDEMEGFRPRLLKIHWDLDYLQKHLPQNYQLHDVLAERNPDYMAFLERHRAIRTTQHEEMLHAEIAKVEDPSERQQLAFKIALLHRVSSIQAKSNLPKILKQQLLDRVAVLDFDGAVATARELENVEPEAAKGLSAWLANDLSYEHAKEIGINTWVSLGNGGLYTAFFTRYISPAAVRNAPVSLANVRAIFSSWNGFNGFLQFAWGRINPFSSLTKGELTPEKLRTASTQILRAAAEQVEQESIQKGILMGYFGVDEKYADFLANALVNVQQVQTDDPGSLMNKTSRNLLRKIDAHIPEKVNVPAWKKLQAARTMMREYWQAMDALAQLQKAQQELADASNSKLKDELGITTAAKLIASLKLKLKLYLNPLNERMIREIMEEYDADLSGKKGEHRIAAHAELFRKLPMAALLKAKKKGELPKNIELKLDAARRELLEFTQRQFLAENPSLAPHVERFIYTGSGARPDWPEYKRLSSDLDFTIILKEGVDLPTRARVKSGYDEYFRRKTGFEPEEFDIHCFADERPRLTAAGHTVAGLLELIKDPKTAEAVAAEGKRTLDALMRDLSDPERYLSTGALRFLHYLNKLGGRAKDADMNDDMTYQSELYRHVKFEPWMGLEMVMDNLKMVGAHSGERMDYAKSLAKYGLRVLFARIIQSDAGMKMANDLTLDQIEANLAKTGGIHGEFVGMAEKLGGRFTPEQLRLFREMNMRKQGKPWSEVFEERLGRKLDDHDDAMNHVIEKHIAEMEGFVKQSLKECLITNASNMKELANAIEASADPAQKEALLLKQQEILFSVSAVWNKLTDAERKTVLASAPAESDYFAALEDVRDAMRKRDIDFIKSYKPFRKRGGTPMDDDI